MAKVVEAKILLGDVPADYGRFVSLQWNALACLGGWHPFVAMCHEFVQDNQLKVAIYSDWKAKNHSSFDASRKNLWFLPLNQLVATTLEAHFDSFWDWVFRLSYENLIAVDFEDVESPDVKRYFESFDALVSAPIDWSPALATVESVQVLFNAGNRQPVSFAKRRHSWVYFVQAIGANRVKIGVTTDIDKRLSQIKTSCPNEIKLLALLPGDTKKEKEYHRKFAEYRESGEWFCVEGAFRQYIEQMTLEEWKDA